MLSCPNGCNDLGEGTLFPVFPADQREKLHFECTVCRDVFPPNHPYLCSRVGGEFNSLLRITPDRSFLSGNPQPHSFREEREVASVQTSSLSSD